MSDSQNASSVAQDDFCTNCLRNTLKNKNNEKIVCVSCGLVVIDRFISYRAEDNLLMAGEDEGAEKAYDKSAFTHCKLSDYAYLGTSIVQTNPVGPKAVFGKYTYTYLKRSMIQAMSKFGMAGAVIDSAAKQWYIFKKKHGDFGNISK